MAAERPPWERCSQEGCTGVRLRATAWCLAHAAEQEPDAFDAELKRISAEGSVDARGVVISAELLARLLEATPRQDDRPTFTAALFNQARFQGEAWFTGVSFQGEARFDGVTFEGGARFTGVSFQAEAWFIRVSFQAEAFFQEVSFEDEALFGWATFEGKAWSASTPPSAPPSAAPTPRAFRASMLATASPPSSAHSSRCWTLALTA